MKKIAVIGSNSFSGADFIDFLLEQGGVEILGLSRSPEKSDLYLAYRRRKSPAFRFVQCDLNRDPVENLLDQFQPEWIANFATQSEVAPSWENPEHWFNTNCVAFARLIHFLNGKKYLKKYLHVSTPEVYGSKTGLIDEGAAMDPSTPYGVSRAAQDQLLKILFARSGFPFVSVRAANVFGAGQQLWKIVPRSIIRLKKGQPVELHGGGTVKRSFIPIRDVSRGELAALERGKPGSIYHLATERCEEVRAVVRAICEMMGRSFENSVVATGERSGQDAAYTLDIARARKDLAWEPAISLEKELRRVLEWIEGHWEAIQKEPLVYEHKP